MGLRRRQWIAIALISVLVLFLLVSCGTKKPETIVKGLTKKVENLEGYKAKGTLVLQTGQLPQQYDVDVWHKKPDFYRIALTNREKSITQIILRNAEGVFVLTPHLNKSFRFQSGWPDRQGQVYLFESLVNSVNDDVERVLVKENKSYMFHVKANYQNRTLTSQKVWFAVDGLAPEKVQVLNADEQVLVELTFHEFTYDPKFEQDAFDMERNMTSSNGLQSHDSSDATIWPVEPTYTPAGVIQSGIEEIEQQEGIVYRITYDGIYSYTITIEQPKEFMVIAPMGEPVDLGFTLGALTQNEDMLTLRFSYEGFDFSIRSANLPPKEMERVAMSVFGLVGK